MNIEHFLTNIEISEEDCLLVQGGVCCYFPEFISYTDEVERPKIDISQDE